MPFSSDFRMLIPQQSSTTPVRPAEDVYKRQISVRASNISKTMAKKLSRVSILDEETQSYTTAAYLIAQLGKNYSLPRCV